MFRAAAAREAPSVMENSVEPATPEPSVTPSHGSSSFDIGTTIDTLRLLPSSAANVAVWRRQFPLDSGAALSLCINEFATPFECTVNMNDGVPETLLSRLSLLDSHGQLAWLRADIALLVQTFAAFANSEKLRIYFGAVRTDQCRKFHVDYVRLRMIATYCGPGTEWIANEDVHRATLEHPPNCPCDANRQILRPGAAARHAHAGDVVLLKGSRFGDGELGAVHRSPPIEQQGVTRVILVVSSVGGARDLAAAVAQ